MEREIRYCMTEDGVRIAYSTQGEGPALLVCPNIYESFSLEHLVPEWRSFMEDLGVGRRLVRYDARGCGLSKRDPDDLSPEGFARDIEAVTRASRLRQYAVFGASTGVPRAIRHAATHPRNVSALVLYGGYARPADLLEGEGLEAFLSLLLVNWEVASQIWADVSVREESPGAGRSIAELMRRATTGEVQARVFRESSSYDVGDYLSRVTAPTLVVHRIDDRQVPFALGEELAQRIPKARLVTLPGAIHHYALGDSDAVLQAISAFLPGSPGARRRHGRSAHGIVRTVLFTDLVAHTEMMHRLGDTRGREVLREHERITRDVLRQHDGHEVKTMGDGFMASFASVTAALECAIGLQRAFAAWSAEAGTAAPHVELQVRVGLNAGEPIAEDDDLFGASVILASRIAAQAGAGEILIPEPVRHLLAGKGFAFADRGEFMPKGFDDAVRLYEVRWREPD